MKMQTSQTTTLLYGVKVGDPDYMEEILYECRGYINIDELRAKGNAWANANGYDRLRISVVDLNVKPDFTKTINQ